MKEKFLHLLKTDTTFRIAPKVIALPLVEVESHWYNCYTTSRVGTH